CESPRAVRGHLPGAPWRSVQRPGALPPALRQPRCNAARPVLAEPGFPLRHLGIGGTVTTAVQMLRAGEEVSLANRVEAALEELRPAMEIDGGGVELMQVTDGAVILRLLGSCPVC